MNKNGSLVGWAIIILGGLLLFAPYLGIGTLYNMPWDWQVKSDGLYVSELFDKFDGVRVPAYWYCGVDSSLCQDGDTFEAFYAQYIDERKDDCQVKIKSAFNDNQGISFPEKGVWLNGDVIDNYESPVTLTINGKKKVYMKKLTCELDKQVDLNADKYSIETRYFNSWGDPIDDNDEVIVDVDTGEVIVVEDDQITSLSQMWHRLVAWFQNLWDRITVSF